MGDNNKTRMVIELPSPDDTFSLEMYRELAYLGYNISKEDDGTLTENNSSSNATSAHGRDEDLAKIEVAILAIIFVLAVFGNGVVLVVLSMRRKKLSRMNLMIVHLALADLFVAFLNVLPQLIWDITFRFYGGDFLCRSVKYFQVVAMYASAYVLVTTAIDRYLAICHPLAAHTWSSGKTHVLVAVAWGLSLVFSIPQVFIFAFREAAPGVYDCWGEFHPMWTMYAYVTWIFVAIYVIPLLLLAVAYGRICFVVWRSMVGKEPSIRARDGKTSYKSKYKGPENGALLQSNRKNAARSSGGQNNPRAHVRGLPRAKVKTIKLTATVIACYVICWGPFFVAQMWGVWDPKAPFTGHAMTIILLLASLNSCTNPWIYLAFSDNLYRQLSRCFRGRRSRFGRGTSSSTYESESRLRSTRISTTEVPSRIESSANGSPAIQMERFK